MSATVQNNMIWIYKEDRLCEMPSLSDAMELSGALSGCLVVSVVGAGGKTTTLHSLAGELVHQGQKVVVTTSTHIVEEDEPYFFKAAAGDHLTDGSQMQEAAQVFSDQIRGKMDCFGQVWTGMPATGGKFCGLPEMFLDQIWKLDIPVLIEADGAKKKPLKVPAGHEPVIHPRTTHVLSVYGLDAVGERLEDVCFREELAEEILEKRKDERVTSEDIALLAASPRAGRKGCPGHAVYTVVLNKADSFRRREEALTICRELKNRGIRRVLVTSYPGSRKKNNR